MGQDIRIVIIDERGITLKELEVNYAEILVEFYESKNFEKDYPLSSTIDPFGDTYFNRLQIPLFIEELKKMKKKVHIKEIENIIDKVIDFVSQADIHEYIKLMGD